MTSNDEATPMPTRRPWQLLLLRVLLSGGCPDWLAARLHRAVRADPAWRAAYEQHRAVDQIAVGGGRALSAGQVDLIEQLVLDGLTSTPTGAATTQKPAQKTTPRWLLPVGAAGAMAVLALVIVRPAPSTSTTPTWTQRGADDHEAPRLGVRARCIAADAVVAQAEAGPRAPAGRLPCARGGLLSLSTTNLERSTHHVFVVGVTAGGELRFVAPFAEGASSFAMAPGTTDVPLDVVADTSSFAAGEPITLFALFATKPLEGVQVARTLRDISGRGVQLKALDTLPFDALTGRIELLP